ncbi:signal peptidase I [Candidatus Woesearchaeota archaeon]|nr:signal peptidase I [Candidatus Woesearchaeota archaeon]
MAGVKGFRQTLKRAWRFLWNDNSVWSWAVNALLAFLLIKFAVYPALGLALQTNHPVVAVISDSMLHTANFDTWWESMGKNYAKHNITKEQFMQFKMSDGFSRGDIIILKGKKPEKIEIGNIIVFDSNLPEPIIHRVVGKWEADGAYYFSTKGDRNVDQRPEEKAIRQDRVVGTAWIKVPYFGYVKIAFTNLVNAVKGKVR